MSLPQLFPGGAIGALAEVSYVGSGASSNAETISIPTHKANDLIVICAMLEGPAAAETPSLPSGWSSLIVGGSLPDFTFRVGYKFATSASETSGTWTGAEALSVGVYRDVSKSNPFGEVDPAYGASGAVNYDAVVVDYPNRSWGAVFAMCTGTGTPANMIPSGISFTLRASTTTDRTLLIADTAAVVTGSTIASDTGSSGSGATGTVTFTINPR